MSDPNIIRCCFLAVALTILLVGFGGAQESYKKPQEES